MSFNYRIKNEVIEKEFKRQIKKQPQLRLLLKYNLR